jgi:hypothetical protein
MEIFSNDRALHPSAPITKYGSPSIAASYLFDLDFQETMHLEFQVLGYSVALANLKEGKPCGNIGRVYSKNVGLRR